MKINITSKSTLYTVIVIAVVLLVSGLGVVYYSKLRSDSTAKQPTIGTVQQKDQANSAASEKAGYLDAQSKAAQQAQPAPAPSSSDAITLSATQNGTTVTVATMLQGFAAGKCDLTVAMSEKKYTASADIIYQPEYSICAGFTVPISSIGTGKWTITLVATPSGGSPLQKTISFEVK